jgi:sec-independent protein translocase protein TatC
MPSHHDYDEDLFADTRMTFGEHIEELRTHLIRAIKGLLFCMVIGFILDAVGTLLGREETIGVGRPMMGVITEPVKQQLNAFYERRLEKLELQAQQENPAVKDATEPKLVQIGLSPAALAAFRGQPAPENDGPVIWAEVLMKPLDFFKLTEGVNRIVSPKELTALSVTETMVVYFKVSLLCGLVIASPWVFWQIWSFIAAGLFPHEKKLVHVYLPISLGLFLGGVALCQFAVIPRSIEALLWFNEWIGIAPDLRLSEWLSFAIILPLVFGISFQTPLVMMFLERIGVATVEWYQSQWKLAVFVLAVVAALITPTPDAVTWFFMWAPMIGLYFLGIYLCRLSGRREEPDYDVPESDELIEV